MRFSPSGVRDHFRGQEALLQNGTIVFRPILPHGTLTTSPKPTTSRYIFGQILSQRNKHTLLAMFETNSFCFTHDQLDDSVSFLGEYKLCKSAHFQQIVQICPEFYSIAQAVDRKSDWGVFSRDGQERNFLQNIQLVSETSGGGTAENIHLFPSLLLPQFVKTLTFLLT